MHADKSGFIPLDRHDPRKIGPYRVVGRIGEGGMGVVYAATDGRVQAAVKLIRPEYAGNDEFRQRFAREVRLLSRIQGPCVASVLGFGTDAARPWLATTYVPGPTLQEYVNANGPLRDRALFALAAGVAEALAAVHRGGVVHRDLKPSNVILSPGGPKVVDFGIARAVDETSITSTHQFVRSTGWISPEPRSTEPHLMRML